MKPMHLWAGVGAFSLLTVLSLSAWPGAREAGEPVFSGGSYLTIIRQETEFASRSVITLQSDHTMLAVDSWQEGPTYYFGSQLGVWPAGGLDQVITLTHSDIGGVDHPLPAGLHLEAQALP